MSSGPTTRVETLCLEALSKDGPERAAFLDDACAGDVALRREVESLLAGRSQASGFLESPAWSPAAPLAPGTRLGAYEVLSLIGEGGMGQVFRARDARLDRTVAIKVLPPAFAADPERRARFEREAKVIASLNHPHICTLHDVGSSEGRAFLVMEHLVGETLAARLERGPLPLDEAVTTGKEIAEALAAAHRQGVVHRDLKPGNVMLTASGAKLLDFGLAKLRAHGEQPAATIRAASSLVTAEGAIVGTLHYMAPEQVEGRTTDGRTDIWALGAVLYEMLAGRRAFEGASAASLIAGILQSQPPPLAGHEPPVPPSLDAVIQKCLAKDADARWQAAGDVVKELEQVGDGLRRSSRRAASLPATAAAPATSRRRRRIAAVALTAAAIVVLAGAVLLWRSSLFGPTLPPRLAVLTSLPGYEGFPALSPDGRQVAFVWTGEKGMRPRLHLKSVGEADAKALTTAPGIEFSPSWSPDGGRIAFIRQPLVQGLPSGPPGIYTTSALGGAEQKVRDVPGILLTGGGLSWSPDKRWLAFTMDQSSVSPPGIYLLPVSGGNLVRVTTPKETEMDRRPVFSWDGRFLAFTRGRAETSIDLLILPLSPDGVPSGAPRKLACPPSWVLIPGITWDRANTSIIASGNDSLAYLYRVWIDGRRPPERIDAAGPAAALPSTSAGSDRLAFAHLLDNPDIWSFRPDGAAEPVVSSTFYDGDAQFSPDGRRLAFTSYRTGEAEIYTAGADGSDPAQLTRGLSGIKGSPVWSPDGRQIAFDCFASGRQADVYVIDADGAQLRRFTTNPTNEHLPAWSRDGRWIYFRSDRSGQTEIWRAPVAGGDWVQMTTTGGARLALESVDGRTLFYTRQRRAGQQLVEGLIAHPLDGQPERQLIDVVADHGVAVMEDGIYYLVNRTLQETTTLYFHDFAQGRSREVMHHAGSTGGGLAVSPDRKRILWSAFSQRGSDLMLIDNFR